jgi:hypothetical protein
MRNSDTQGRGGGSRTYVVVIGGGSWKREGDSTRLRVNRGDAAGLTMGPRFVHHVLTTLPCTY